MPGRDALPGPGGAPGCGRCGTGATRVPSRHGDAGPGRYPSGALLEDQASRAAPATNRTRTPSVPYRGCPVTPVR